MKGIVVIGAGKIGATIAGLLASTGDYQVTLADRSPEVLGNLDRDQNIHIMAADAEDSRLTKHTSRKRPERPVPIISI